MDFALPKPVVAFCLFLALVCAGCGKRNELQVSQPEKNDTQALPFEQRAAREGKSPTAVLSTGAIPSGMPVTVRLETELSSADATRGQVFTAVLDQPIVFGGQLLVPDGSRVVGEVLAARPFRPGTSAGYLRITLTRIVVNGHVLPLKTSSLFAKGNVVEKRGEAPVNAVAGAADLESVGSNGMLLNASGRGLTSVRSPLAAEPDAELLPEQRLTFRIARVVPLAG